ncbi:MAG: hypothetical protein A4E45_02146 [Methanosaeta sp. PtaB.Bin039]|nr:MAG: hypothetical protein A4E45_02146 [Methanosaeta sp. PtaB.Bin039]
MSYATLGILASRIPNSNEMNDEEMRPVDYGVNDGFMLYFIYLLYYFKYICASVLLTSKFKINNNVKH